MKYIVIVGDGMADLPLKELEGRTPLNVAHKPGMDFLANHGINGRVMTVPHNMTPESDTANLALLGYDPKIYSRGRSPLEAASMGINMAENETAIRANLVALSDNGEEYSQKIMLDHSADEISTQEADILIKAVQERFGDQVKKFYTGISYRHCLIWKDCSPFDDFTRPHDILNQKIQDYLPKKADSQPMKNLMEQSFELLNNHPLNIERAKKGLKKANSLWLWGTGKKMTLPYFKDKTGLEGSVVCAVDLIKGIGIVAGMSAPEIEGATGTLDTNYKAKMQAALSELKAGKEFVFIHVEAPDECGHRGEIQNKIKAIENIDREIVLPLIKAMDEWNTDYKILLTPDHPTPIYARTHTLDAVPFVIYSSKDKKKNNIEVYDEQSGYDGGMYIEKGHTLIDMLIGNN